MSLFNAAKNGNVNAVKKLLNNGANVNQANDNEGKTPLYGASKGGHTEVVKLLLAKGADVNKASVGEFGLTPLHWASQEGYTEIVKMLLAKGANVNKADKDGETPLYYASYSGQTEAVKVLLKAGADANKADREGITPLWWASKDGRTAVVKLLLAVRGIDVNKADKKDGTTPLYAASKNGRTAVVKLLIAKGADVNKADKDGNAPLLLASDMGRMDVVKLLLGAPGIDVNLMNKNGQTPLFWASWQGHTEVVKLLLAEGADPFKKGGGGRTALDVAKTEAVKKLLREAMGITLRWKNMNASQRNTFKPILLKRMIAKGLKNGKNATFTEPIIYANYKYINLKPVNNKNKNITSFGLVIDDKNNVKSILDLEGARRAMRNVRDRANREGKTVEQPLPGIIFKNWELINFTPNEYFNAMKDLQKLSAIRKGKRTRNNLKSGNLSRIRANEKKTAEIANLRSTIRKASKRLNNLM